MKQGTLLNRIVMLLLLAAIALYFGVYAWRSWTDPLSTALSYLYTVDDTVEVTGFLAREEMPIPSQSGIVDLLPAEGEKVARGQAVAVLYQSTSALDRRQELRALELEREQLQHSLSQEDAGRDAAQLNQAVIQSIVRLRAAVAQDDLAGLENDSLNLKSLVYRRDYTYGQAGGGASLEEAIARVDGQIAALAQQSGQDTLQVRAEQAGVFSGLVDGYEDLLAPGLLEGYTPSDLDRLSSRRVQTEEGAYIGKLITSSRWYFICPMSQADAGRLYEGGAVTVRFSRDWAGEVDMQVMRIGPPEGDRVAVVLSTDRFLSDTTLLRQQTVELVFDSVSGIRVPNAAIRVVARTVADSETGQERQVQVTGVYVLVGSQAEFKAVEVLAQLDDFCLVQPVAPTTAREQRELLRAGDEIIVTAGDLFDGKVVR